MAEQVEWTVVSRRRARRGKGGPPAAVGAEAGRRPDRGQQQEKEQERQKVALPAWHQANLRCVQGMGPAACFRMCAHDPGVVDRSLIDLRPTTELAHASSKL